MNNRVEDEEWERLTLLLGKGTRRLIEAARLYGQKRAESGAGLGALIDQFLDARPALGADACAASDLDLALKAALEAYLEARLQEVEAAQDPVTHLRGRGAFERALAEECARARRYSRFFALTLIDLDGFKAINDRFGHQAGDRVLGEVARVLRSSLRRSDQVFRYGGDEFAVLSPETSLTEMGRALERVEMRLQELQESRLGANLSSLGLSWGIAGFPEEAAGAEGLVRLADERLYARKRARLSER